MLELAEGDVRLVANGLPPVDALYHRAEFALVPAVATIVPDPQTEVLFADGAAGMGFTVRVLDIRGAVLSHIVEVL